MGRGVGRGLLLAAFGGALLGGLAWGQDPAPQAHQRLEAAVRAGDAAASASALDEGAGTGDADALLFWRAQACLLAGRDAEAAGLFGRLAEDRTSPYFKEAVLSHGALWAGRGETTRALRALEAGLESDDPEFLAALRLRLAELHVSRGGAVEARALLKAAPASLERSALEARAAWMQGQMEEAAQLAGPVAAQAPAGAARDTARLVQARVKAAAGQILEADRALLEWVRAEPGAVPLPSVVLALEEFRGLAAEEVNTLFDEWKVDPKSPLAAAAAYGQAAAQAGRGETPAAAAAFDAFATEHGSHSLAPTARARSVELALAASQPAQARLWAEAWLRLPGLDFAPAERARATFLAGLAAWQDGAFTAAATAFKEAARLAPDPGSEQAARLNAALCSVEAGGAVSLDGLEAWPEAGRTVHFEAGLFAARTGHPDAAARLEAFLASMPAGDPRGPAAWAALVELDLARPTPAVAAARQRARAALRTATDPAWREQAAWLAVLVEAAAGDWGAALEKSSAFLAAWPQTERRAQARFQRAEWFGRQENWTGAIEEYTLLAAEADAQPAAGARALYLAGLAELRLPSPDSLDRAIDRWSDAAGMDDSLAFPARYQQALAKSRLGKTEEAIQQLDALLTGPPAPTTAQRSAVQLARGELLLLPLANQPDRSADALAALQSVAEEPGGLTPRRARALFHCGEALARLGRTDEALTALTEAAHPLLSPAADSAAPAGAIPWAARAGLAAVSLLESSRNWSAAAALAQRLAATPGPHAAAARARAARLRLEHFLWEE
jgi:lipopolysaccharide biosynthesis regulator YciM